MNSWQTGVLLLTAMLTAVVLVKLWHAGLIKIYRLLFCFLAVDLLSSAVPFLIDFHSTAYGNTYFSLQTLKIVIAAFMLVEIYSLALERHPALAQFGRNTVGYMLAAAAVMPAIVLLVDRSATTKTPLFVRMFFLFEQTTNATMAIFLILLSLFLAWFPVRMRRNVIVYIGGFIAWSLSRSAMLLVINHWFNNRTLTDVSNIVQTCIELGCLTLWALGFQREGETRTAVVGHLWNRAEAERLAEQLDSINDSLARMRSK
jgi:hypothetical protein